MRYCNIQLASPAKEFKKRVPCAVYSGQYKDEENVENFSSWREGKAVIMVATSAFGQGIDYPRNVDLSGLTYSLEEYSQQCGRAGRDGKPSSACLTFVLYTGQFCCFLI